MIKRLPIDEYDALAGVRYSHLKAIFTSPKHYDGLETGTIRKSSSSMTAGSAAHAAVFEPARYAEEYKTYFGKTRRGKIYDEWCALNVGCTSITKAERAIADNIARAVRGDPVAAKYLVGGEAEVAIQWTDHETGLSCKGRVDYLIEVDDYHCIVGLKTTKSISDRAFSRQAFDLGYPLQWAMYRAGYFVNTGVNAKMVEIVVENHAPWDVVVYRIHDAVLDYGMAQFRKGLAMVADCKQRKEWEGVARGQEVDFALPPWAMTDENIAISLDGVEDVGEVGE